MKICPVCDSQNQDGAKNCETCGESLGIPQAAPPTSEKKPAAAPAPAPQSAAVVPKPAVAIGPKYCPIEGIEYTKGAAEYDDGFCSCGAELVADKSLVAPGAKPLPPEDRGLPADKAASGPAVIAAGTGPAAAPPVAATPTPAPEPVVVALPPPPPPGPVMPPPGTYCLVVYQNKKPVHYHPLENDETLIGRYDPASGADPELDLSKWDESAATSRKHAYVYRQESQYSLKPITNAGTQLGKELVPMGERKPLTDGDVVVLSSKVALKFIQVK